MTIRAILYDAGHTLVRQLVVERLSSLSAEQVQALDSQLPEKLLDQGPTDTLPTMRARHQQH